EEGGATQCPSPLRRRVRRRDELRLDIGRRAPGGLIERFQVFPDRPGNRLRVPLLVPIRPWDRTLAIGISLDEAGIDRKALATDQTLCDAALHHRLEQMAEHIALAEAAMAVLREGRMIRHLTFPTQSAEPAVGQVQVHLLAQPALR